LYSRRLYGFSEEFWLQHWRNSIDVLDFPVFFSHNLVNFFSCPKFEFWSVQIVLVDVFDFQVFLVRIRWICFFQIWILKYSNHVSGCITGFRVIKYSGYPDSASFIVVIIAFWRIPKNFYDKKASHKRNSEKSKKCLYFLKIYKTSQKINLEKNKKTIIILKIFKFLHPLTIHTVHDGFEGPFWLGILGVSMLVRLLVFWDIISQRVLGGLLPLLEKVWGGNEQ
jgi:hypothetical protein